MPFNPDNGHVSFDGVRGYASHAAAMKTGNRVASACNVPVKWIVSINAEGRFVPTFVLKDANMHMMHWITSNPQCVVMSA